MTSAYGRGEERGRENICFPVEEGLGKPWVSQNAPPHVAFVIKKSTFFFINIVFLASYVCECHDGFTV